MRLAIMLIGLLLTAPVAAVAQEHQHGFPPAAPKTPPAEDHSQHQPEAPLLPPFIPPLTDEDRAAAFPDVHGHTVHDNAVNTFVLFDHLEWQGGAGEPGAGLGVKGWIGRDIDRFWFRTKGDLRDGRVAHAEVHALYGRAIAPWWDLVAGVRQDVRPGPAQTWAAIGIQGLAPYWFEVEATAYVSTSGRTHLRVETEYELLLTNRLVLQPVVGFDLYGKSDPGRGTGAGLSSGDAGLRLRYEIRREFAPYVGVVWSRTFFGTADRARAAGDPTAATRLVAGLRLWM
jgi:copper resistance protein B